MMMASQAASAAQVTTASMSTSTTKEIIHQTLAKAHPSVRERCLESTIVSVFEGLGAHNGNALRPVLDEQFDVVVAKLHAATTGCLGRKAAPAFVDLMKATLKGDAKFTAASTESIPSPGHDHEKKAPPPRVWSRDLHGPPPVMFTDPDGVADGGDAASCVDPLPTPRMLEHAFNVSWHHEIRYNHNPPAPNILYPQAETSKLSNLHGICLPLGHKDVKLGAAEMCAELLPSTLVASGVVRRTHRRSTHSKFGVNAGGGGDGGGDGGEGGSGGGNSSGSLARGGRGRSHAAAGGCFPRAHTRRFLHSRMYSNDTLTPWQWRWHGVLWRVCSQSGQDGVLFEIFRHLKVSGLGFTFRHLTPHHLPSPCLASPHLTLVSSLLEGHAEQVQRRVRLAPAQHAQLGTPARPLQLVDPPARPLPQQSAWRGGQRLGARAPSDQ